MAGDAGDEKMRIYYGGGHFVTVDLAPSERDAVEEDETFFMSI